MRSMSFPLVLLGTVFLWRIDHSWDKCSSCHTSDSCIYHMTHLSLLCTEWFCRYQSILGCKTIPMGTSNVHGQWSHALPQNNYCVSSVQNDFQSGMLGNALHVTHISNSFVIWGVSAGKKHKARGQLFELVMLTSLVTCPVPSAKLVIVPPGLAKFFNYQNANWFYLSTGDDWPEFNVAARLLWVY